MITLEQSLFKAQIINEGLVYSQCYSGFYVFLRQPKMDPDISSCGYNQSGGYCY